MLSAKRIKPLRTQLILFGTFITFGLTIALVSFLLSSYLQTKTLRKELSHDAHTELRVKQQLFKLYRQRAEKALEAARYCEFVVDYLHARDNTPLRTSAERCLLAITNTLPEISQLRYLDEQGLERIRVDKYSENTQAFSTELSGVQNRSDRYYAKKIAQLTDGAIWHSALDLNVEQGQIVQPFEPTLRVATPIYTEGRYQGFMIINIQMQPILNQLINSRLFDVILTDNQGQLLVHSLRGSDAMEHLWAGVIGELETLQQRWPDIAAQALNHSDIFENEGRFSLALKTNATHQPALFLLLTSKPGALLELRTQERKYLILVTLVILLCSLFLGLSFSSLLSHLNRKLLDAQEVLSQQMALVDRYIPITRTDTEGHITSSNPAFRQLLGYSSEELLGYKHSICQHEGTSSGVHANLWASLKAEQEWSGEIKDRCKDGHTIWLNLQVSPDYDSRHQLCGYTAIFRDISLRKLLEQQALTDSLTKLYNRRHFDATCPRELGRCTREDLPLGLALIDTDCFKQYNDTFGHEAGDQILTQVAKCMTQGLHRSTDFAFRIGGDEFAILFSGIDIDQGTLLLERIRKSLEQLKIKHPGNGGIGIVTISVGVALVEPSRSNTQVELFQAADEALYQAKNSGRNRVCLSATSKPQASS